jgi:hypothetical protein
MPFSPLEVGLAAVVISLSLILISIAFVLSSPRK